MALIDLSCYIDYTIESDELLSDMDDEDIVDEYDALSNYCLNADIEQTCNDIVIRALIDGSAYTYETIDSDGSVITQFLPADYCRSRTFDKYGNRIVEMNFK